MTISFNSSPYYDDYDENKKFYRILFNPVGGRAVQARELTQLQSILSKQIERHGRHIFKEGSMVIPGQVSIDTEYNYVKLEETFSNSVISSFLENLEGLVVVGQSSGVRGRVRKVAINTENDPNTIFVKYLDSGTDTEHKTFEDGENIAPEDGDLSAWTVKAQASEATGVGSAASVERGVYFVKGFFVLLDSQSIVLDKYTNTPSYRIGLDIEEKIIEPEDDESLLSNAQGTPNFAAPGAHRYYIDLILNKRTLDTEDDSNFVQIASTRNGVTQQKVSQTEYNILEQALARRTYDESGDYTVRPFAVDIREHRNNNRGEWETEKGYLAGDIVTNNGNYYRARNDGESAGVSGPTHTVGEQIDGTGGITWLYIKEPTFNRGVFTPENGGDSTKLALGIEPGKAYVRGYEIEKIATTYIPVDKARDTNTVSDIKLPATIGNYALITNLHNSPRFDQFAEVKLYDQLTSTPGNSAGSQVGTARIRFVEHHSGNLGSTSTIYKASLFSVSMNTGKSFSRNAKQFFFDAGSTAANFTADIEPEEIRLTGSVTTDDSVMTVLSGDGTLFTHELKVGDYIRAGDTEVRRVTAVTSNNEIEIDSSIDVVGVAFYRLETRLNEQENNTLIFPTPYYAVKTVRSTDDSIGTSYTVTERFTGTISSGAPHEVTFAVDGGNDVFASTALTSNYLLIDTTDGSIINPSAIELQTGGTQVKFTVDAAYADNAVVLFAAVNKSGAGTEKIKTLTTASPFTITGKAAATSRKILLGNADGYKLLSVMMDVGGFSAPSGNYTVDITDRYYFNSGQKPTYYDLANITLKELASAPIGPIEVRYQYFSHTSSGDYFTVNSYLSSINYEDVPEYEGISLRDVIDFRPKIANDGSGFTGSGSSISGTPKRGIDIETDLEYYLARKDNLAINLDGEFKIVSGVSSLDPKEPNSPSKGMLLYKFEFEPYTFGAENINVVAEKIDNKRYTMRDIGRIDKRVDNLEYYTSLSLLEQETKSLTIPDEDGLDRFKNGFIVDDFKDHGVANSSHPDHRCSVDMEKGVLRPFHSMKNVKLLELNTNTAQRSSDGYQVTGDLITLPYSNIEFIKQPYGSRTENVNPFAIFTFLGNVTLNPPNDDWIETDRRPDLVNEVEGNFNTMVSLAEEAGVMGTVWNSWETQWAGSWRRTGLTRNTQRGQGDGRNWPIRTITRETRARQVGQARTGINTEITARIDREITDDRVVARATIPFIRSRNVLFLARGLKPSTRFYPFFDGEAISSYVTPGTKISFDEIIGFSGDFNFETNAGGNADETARQVDGDTEVCLDHGDVIEGQTSGATAVVVLKENSVEAGRSIYVSNIQGTFQNGEIIIGSLSGARGTINAPVVVASAGDALKTNFAGDAVGLYSIPNSESLRFRTGIREFRLSDDDENDLEEETSSGTTQYRAEGVLETWQATITATRNAEIVRNQVTAERTITQTTRRVISDTGWVDPLAQTFLVQQSGGAFLTKLDLYFATKDPNIPVRVEIREVVNGYPGKNILPFSQVIKTPDLVPVDPDEGASVTTFEFPSPVFVEDGEEYCVVILSDSNEYNVWISQLGELAVGTDRFISEQPYAGVLFKSQNASTWTADQEQDLKFTLHRASFTTNQFGEVEFVNDRVKSRSLPTQPFQTANGSTKIRVNHISHGMSNGSSVTISGVSESVNGIDASEFNTTHTISNVELDSYVITVTSNATSSGVAGGTGVKASQNAQYETLRPSLQIMDFSDTSIEFLTKTTTGQSVNGNETPYVLDSEYQKINANSNNELNRTNVVASPINESVSILSGSKSLYILGRLFSTNESLSPVIDTERISAILVNNKTNNPTSQMNEADLDTRIIVDGDTNIAFENNEISSAVTDTQNLLKTINVGRYIEISGASNAENDIEVLVTDVSSEDGTITVDGTFTTEAAGSSITISSYDRFVEEIAPENGSTYNAYVSRRVDLLNASTCFDLRLAASIPPSASIEMYYKIMPIGSSENFEDINYTLIEPETPISNNTNDKYIDVEYLAEDLDSFEAIAIKLVMKSSNAARVPKLKDLRIIACA